MSEALEHAIADLQSPRAGWVSRRHAADDLGHMAARALAALYPHVEDPDVEVRVAVENAIAAARSALAGQPPRERTYTLEELANACVRPGRRSVVVCDNGYLVHVKLDQKRKQTVYVMPHTRRDGIETIRVYTYCGELDMQDRQDLLTWALRSNLKLTHCALALLFEGDEERLILVRTFLRQDVSPRQMVATVKEIAHYGDWMESKLSGLDDL